MLDQNLIDKIRKVASLTDSPNEHEAAAAAEKLQAMLAEHNLSMTDLGVDNTIHQIIRDKDFLTYFAGWIKPLLNTVSKLYFCYYYYESFPTDWIKGLVKKGELDESSITKLYVGSNSRTYLRHNFIGEEQNVVVAKYMGEYLIATMERLCREATKAYDGDKSSFRYSYMNACAAQLCARLAKRREESSVTGIKENGTNLPALLSLYQQAEQKNQEFVESLNANVKTKKSLIQVKNQEGASAGSKAGKEIGLDTQIEGEGKHLRIG